MAAPKSSDRSHRPLEIAAVCVLLAYLLWNSLYFAPYLVDDAFISFRYARMLLSGEGLVFNPGERVEGFSNFLWVIVEAGILFLGLPVVTATKVASTACGLATGWMTYALGRRLLAGTSVSRWALFACAAVCLNTSLAVWMQACLETAFFGMLVLASVLRFEVERGDRSRHPLSALLFAATWMTRPEAPAYGLYFVVRRLGAARKDPLCRRDALWVALAAGVVVPYELWGLLYYGHLVPNTHVAKVESDGVTFVGRLFGAFPTSHLYEFVTNQGFGLPALLGLSVVGCLRRLRGLPAAFWAPLASGLVFVLYAWSDWMPRYRFFVPLLPFLFLVVAYGLEQLGQIARASKPLHFAWLAIVLVLFGSYAEHQAFGAYFKVRDREHYRLATEERGAWFADVPGQNARDRLFPLEEVSWRILRELRAGETAAIRDIGVPGYLTMNPIWDVRGLVTPSMARGRSGDPEALAVVLDELARVRPTFILLGSGHGNRPARVLDEALAGDARIAELYERSEARGGGAEYVLRGRTPPDSDARIRAALEAFPEYAREGRLAQEYARSAQGD